MGKSKKSLFKEQLYSVWGVEFIDLIAQLTQVKIHELGEFLKNYEGAWYSISDFIDCNFEQSLKNNFGDGEIDYVWFWSYIKDDYVIYIDNNKMIHHIFKK